MSAIALPDTASRAGAGFGLTCVPDGGPVRVCVPDCRLRYVPQKKGCPVAGASSGDRGGSVARGKGET
jgi:hypothetical protein